MSETKQEVREFYDRVGWQRVGGAADDPLYQNAHYEDLRPVAREYIHRCHLRVGRFLPPRGRYLLDAGSGPVQYAEYLTYSAGYSYRVCADISRTALQEAKRRLGDHALCVVADVANLPFRAAAFDGIVSLHTLHHLPEDEHLGAYVGLYRVLRPGGSAAIVNGWPQPRLMQLFDPLVRWRRWLRILRGKPVKRKAGDKGTFTSRHNVRWIKAEVGGRMPVEIRVWRSVSVRFLRALIKPQLGGRWLLRALYRLEEWFPHFFGENGQYPLLIVRKPPQES
jgi:SAM-dependent methyltransferase